MVVKSKPAGMMNRIFCDVSVELQTSGLSEIKDHAMKLKEQRDLLHQQFENRYYPKYSIVYWR